MPATITKLTDDQIAAIPGWVDRYVRIGTCTDPIDRTTLRKKVDGLYGLLDKKPPVAIVVMDGPIHAWLATVMLSMGDQVYDQVRAQVHAQVHAQVYAQVRAQVYDQVRAQVYDQVHAQVYDQVYDQVHAQVYDQVYDQVRAQVHAQVYAQVRAQVYDQVRAQVYDQVHAQVYDQVHDQVRAQVHAQVYDQVHDFLWPYCDGQFWASWYGLVDFYLWIGAKVTSELRARYESCREMLNMNLIYPLEQFCVLSERMGECNLSDGRLHNESGPSVSYRDGLTMWSIRGARVDEQIVMKPESQTIKQIDAEPNAELQRIRIERYGWNNYLRKKRAKVIEHVRNDISQTDESLMQCDDKSVLVCACPSTARVYALEVPSECRTVEQAQNFLSGNRARRIVGAT